MSNRRFWIFLIAGLTLITLVIGGIANNYLINKRIERAAERLALLGTLRHDALARYLDTAEAELGFWSDNDFLREQQTWMVESWQAGVDAGRDPAAFLRAVYIEGNSSPLDEKQAKNAARYSELHARLQPMAERFLTVRGYYDFLLISPSGDIHYSAAKEDDFATNLLSGPYRDSGLGDAFRQAIEASNGEAIGVSDLQAYAPSGGAPAMFIAKAMHDDEGLLIGVIALQVPTEQIQAIMHFVEGMGDTGETYLVGEDHIMRSDSRFSEEPTVLKMRVDSDIAQRALSGEYGVEFTTDYRGVEVLSAFSSIPIGETHWAILAEIDRAEILQQATQERPMIAGFMLFFYSLGIWSAWFMRRSESDGTGGDVLSDLELDSATDFLSS
jgi:methyl-accepting chemotaxis protein